MLNANPSASPDSHGLRSTHLRAVVNASSIRTLVSRWENSPLILSAVQAAPIAAARAVNSASVDPSSRRTMSRLMTSSV